MEMRVLVLYNPVAGGRNRELFLQKIGHEFGKFGLTHTVLHTTGSNDDARIRNVMQEFNPDSILVLGGDGTINLAASAIIHTQVVLGIIPFGSANGMAFELGIDSNENIALENFIKSRYVSEVDILWINEEYYCIHIGDVGLNAQVVEGFSREKERGMGTYARHFLRELTQSEMMEFHITADGHEYTEHGYMLAFANARCYGTGVVLNWLGNPYDGKFELVIAQSLELKSLLIAGLSRFNNEIARAAEGSRIISCKEAKIKLAIPVTAQADGEVFGKFSELNIAIIPRAVRVVRVNPEYLG